MINFVYQLMVLVNKDY